MRKTLHDVLKGSRGLLPQPWDICGLCSREAAENLRELVKCTVYKYLITMFTALQQHSFGWGKKGGDVKPSALSSSS